MAKKSVDKTFSGSDMDINRTRTTINEFLEKIATKIGEDAAWNKVKISEKEYQLYEGNVALILLIRFLNRNCVYCNASKDIGVTVCHYCDTH